jgi:P27 family predicted phage terminase small subunit
MAALEVMMPGRKPKPTALKIAQGNPGKRPLRKDEPQYPNTFGERPEQLEGHAAKEWDRLVPQMEATGVAQSTARGEFIMLCQAWADWLEAQGHLRQEKAVVFDKEHGRWMRNPWLIVAKQAYEQYSRLCANFGLDPSSKTKAATAGPKKPTIHDPWEDF